VLYDTRFGQYILNRDIASVESSVFHPIFHPAEPGGGDEIDMIRNNTLMGLLWKIGGHFRIWQLPCNGVRKETGTTSVVYLP